ncbi:MAG TPA: urease accessory protein UreF [Candidatus Corynebacterium gallistercoris]|uniref:Urease accessory protein UreF n=1 Tax=Candidatus Corynebacterium gallistercoris TaxID=2838530 RepID=A0A9D1RY20_9CORY|nr:urease accessory protein UreF [Candidatus Corynebacterium gallistercoris]
MIDYASESAPRHSTAHLSTAALIHAVVFGDSAYPSGRYTLSHGLEGLVQRGRVQGVQQCTDALLDHLRITAAPGDGVATAVATMIALSVAPYSDATLRPNYPQSVQEAIQLLGYLDAELEAMKVTQELRKASTRVGRQTLQVYAQVEEMIVAPQTSGMSERSGAATVLAAYSQRACNREVPGGQAVALGLIHAVRSLDAEQAVAVELTGLAVGWSSAALRLSQCDHIGAQAMVARATPLIKKLAAQCAEYAGELLSSADLGNPRSFATLGRSSPGLDIASAQHQTAPARLFMS